MFIVKHNGDRSWLRGISGVGDLLSRRTTSRSPPGSGPSLPETSSDSECKQVKTNPLEDKQADRNKSRKIKALGLTEATWFSVVRTFCSSWDRVPSHL